MVRQSRLTRRPRFLFSRELPSANGGARLAGWGCPLQSPVYALLDWLRQPFRNLADVISHFLLFLVLVVLWNLLIFGSMLAAGTWDEQSLLLLEGSRELTRLELGMQVYDALIWNGPFTFGYELFRAICLTIFVMVTRQRITLLACIFLFAISEGLLWGWVSGLGPANIPLQGFTGIILSLCYLKCGGAWRQKTMGLVITWLVHATYHAIVLMSVLLYLIVR